MTSRRPRDPASERTQSDFDAAASRRLAPLSDSLDLDSFQAVWMLHQAADAARRHVETSVLSDHDLTWSQFEVLWHLWIFGQDQPRHVVRAIGIPKSSLNQVVGELVRRGWVSRDANPHDARLVELTVTRRGSAFMRRLFPRFNQAEAALTTGLSRPQKRQLATLLRVVVQAERENPLGAQA